MSHRVRGDKAGATADDVDRPDEGKDMLGKRAEVDRAPKDEAPETQMGGAI
jgi:hypothetical protein